MGVELVFSLPPGFKDDQRIFFGKCLRWTELHFPQPAQIIAAIAHLDEALPHLHIILVPIVEHGRMAGHGMVGYKGVYTKRVNSFHDEVAQRFGLRKPRRKMKLTSAQRHQLADRIIAQLMADGWVASPVSVKEMSRMLIADPLPMAQSMGLSAHDADAIESQQNAYAVAVDSVPALPDGSTALLCNAVDGGVTINDNEIGHVDSSETMRKVSSASSIIVPNERPRPKQWVEIMTGVVSPERPAWGARNPRPVSSTSRPERMGAADATGSTRHIRTPADAGLRISPARVSARSQVMLGLRAAGHMRGHAW